MKQADKQKSKLSFAQKVRKREKTILYEFLPPTKNLSERNLASSIQIFSSLLSEYTINAINIPEVYEETRSGKRNVPILAKLKPRVVSSYIQKYVDCEVVINRPVVHLPWEKQQRWFLETYHKYGIRNIVLVGGESSNISYPGFSVIKTARMISSQLHKSFPDIFLGGIIIPTRVSEAKRVFAKASAGIEFFTTQVLYSADELKQLLKQYWNLCLENNVPPKTIFLSFAPVVTPKDIDFLIWLGVEMSKKTIDRLKTGWLGMGFRSISVCERILEDILQFAGKNHIDVPLGLNVEHISRHNFELSFLLLEKLSGIYKL